MTPVSYIPPADVYSPENMGLMGKSTILKATAMTVSKRIKHQGGTGVAWGLNFAQKIRKIRKRGWVKETRGGV